MMKQKREREPLNRQRIIDAGFAYADRFGWERLSMRTLARLLGVEAMSLYKHVKNKEDILDGLSDRILEKIQFPKESLKPKEQLRQLSISKRNLFQSHPWALNVLDSRTQFSLTRLNFLERQFSILRKTGLGPTETYRILLSLESYIYGFVIQESHWNFTQLPKGNASPLFPVEGIPNHELKERFPYFTGFFSDFLEKTKKRSIASILEEEFLWGLDKVLSQFRI
ncbi:probable transcriptional regulator [Leptospira ryugenii]|uniref:Probable transcriptional regulator n=1 Tax=Leptospira ryugenii TaxID=1917863 RepID=A0A2P2DVM6_9LEPT|nr:TetR/AcrR family transcriptional regulator [Leptospira ryugenii]GBF48657.1 probable transcriptional regulator [Leptospira ryugenii]